MVSQKRIVFLVARPHLNSFRQRIYGLVADIIHQSEHVLVANAVDVGCRNDIVDTHKAAATQLAEALAHFEQSRTTLEDDLLTLVK